MFRRFGLIAVFGLLIALVGCAAPAPTPAPAPPAASPAPAKEAPKPAEKPAEKPAAAQQPGADPWGTVTVRKGETIKIGLGATLSGENAPLGQDIRNGATIAVEDVNKDGIKGFKIELLAEDDQCTGDGGRAVAERFAANPQIVGVIGMMCSSGSLPASDTLNRAHIVMISPSSTSPALTARNNPIFNRTAWNDRVQGAQAAKFARETLKVTRAAAIHDGSPYGQGLADVFRQEFQRLGGTVTNFEGITVGEKDFRPVLTRIAANKPELIYFGGFIAEGALLVAQKNDVGMRDVKFMGADGIKSDKYIEAARGAAEGSYSSSADVPSTAQLREFRQRYQQRFNIEPEKLGPFHGQAYDAVRLLAQKISEVSTVDTQGNLVIGRKALADAVRATRNFNGLTGTLSCDANGDCGLAAIAFFEVKQGKFEKVGG
jgi:branched-chain amino acid transport system substrate-binding protein